MRSNCFHSVRMDEAKDGCASLLGILPASIETTILPLIRKSTAVVKLIDLPRGQTGRRMSAAEAGTSNSLRSQQCSKRRLVGSLLNIGINLSDGEDALRCSVSGHIPKYHFLRR